jgi:hypothetical protein
LRRKSEAQIKTDANGAHPTTKMSIRPQAWPTSCQRMLASTTLKTGHFKKSKESASFCEQKEAKKL